MFTQSLASCAGLFYWRHKSQLHKKISMINPFDYTVQIIGKVYLLGVWKKVGRRDEIH